jgi:hypothetical protein
MRGSYHLRLRWAVVVFLMAGAGASTSHAQPRGPEGYSVFDPPTKSEDASAARPFDGELELAARLPGHTLEPPPPEPIVDRAQFQQAICEDEFTLQFGPSSLLYKSYLAGEKEPRISSSWLVPKQGNLVWENTLGGRVGVVRYGNNDPLHPEGWQFDLEGAVMARVDPQAPSSPLIAADFRIGLLSTWRFGDTAIKAGYYHLSSHAGDEFLIANPGFQRVNYVRDALLVGITEYLTDDLSVYGEFAYAFNAEDGAKPIELQYGIQYAPLLVGWPGTPYVAINGHTREDFGYITSVNVLAGWMLRSRGSNRTLRLGMQYYNGPSMQWEFVNQNESLLGGGIWFDY